MTNNVFVHFTYEDCMYGISVKASVEDVTLSMLQEKIYKKLGLDERKEKLKLSYIPMVIRCKKAVTIADDDDLYVYLGCVDKENQRCLPTKTSVKLDDSGKFKYLFIALGACIEGFAVMRKVIVVDATWLKNGYGGVLIFAKAQDPNRHGYPLAFAVLDGESHASWTWFFEMLRSVIPDSSELVFMSDRNSSLIFAIANVYPQAHHGHCLWHLKENVKGHASNVTKDVVGHRFMELGKMYTMADFNAAYERFKLRFPSAYTYVEEKTEKDKWARVFFPRDRYNLDTSNSVESMNKVFREARRWALIPMLDCIIRTFSDWFNQRRKDAVSQSLGTMLVPLVENYLHDLWVLARTLPVRELNSYELEYEVKDSNGKMFLTNLIAKTCTCMVWNYEKIPCLHGLAAYIYYTNVVDNEGGRSRDINIVYHELCSKYYWTELWALAYCRTIYAVPDMFVWEVPDHIRELKIIPPDPIKRKGRKRVNRLPSGGERRRRTQNKKRPRQNFGFSWLLFGNGSSPSEQNTA